MAYKPIYLPWKKWLAWRPIIINNERIWLKKIYRRKVIDMGAPDDPMGYHSDPDKYEYGTILDVLKDGNK